MPRRTLATQIELSGTGLHSGTPCRLRLVPAAPGTGITFRRTDHAGAATLRAIVDAVTDTDHQTVLGSGDDAVGTVEHVLAAAAAHRIDDLAVELSGPEPPAGDGSAAPIFAAIAEAGTAERAGSETVLHLPGPIAVTEGPSRYLAAPADALSLTVTIESPHPAIGRQSGRFDITAGAFERELARARTFGLASDRDALRSRGLAQGASLENTIVLGAERPEVELRWPDEFVRHKTVDLLGDLALTGARVAADIVAFRPSHAGNVAFARVLTRLAAPASPAVMGIEDILDVMPHRYPMLLVDRIIEVHGHERIVGIKNVTINEPYFQGHFPDHPIMPGVLIVEAMAQVGGMLLMGTVDDPTDKVVYFLAIDNVKFRRPVVPGDRLRFEVEMVQGGGGGRNCRMRGVGYVEGAVAAEADMLARVVDR